MIGEGLDPGDSNERIYWFFHLAAVRACIAVSPALDQKQAFVVPPADQAMDREEGYALLARRFLEAYGPATPRDLAYWGKVTLTDAKRAFAAPAGWRRSRPRAGRCGPCPATARPADRGEPVVRLLPLWENYLLGYEDRELACPSPTTACRAPASPRRPPTALVFGHWRIERRRRLDRGRGRAVRARLPKGVRDGARGRGRGRRPLPREPRRGSVVERPAQPS